MQEMKPIFPLAPSPSSKDEFSYPMNFPPIPYHAPLPFQDLIYRVIPLARTAHIVKVRVSNVAVNSDNGGTDMDLDLPQDAVVEASCESDGLLLYDAQASYESGTTPLSLWVPVKLLNGERESRLDALER